MVLIKFIFIFFLALWLISKVGGFLMRMLFGKLVNQQQQKHQNYQKNYRKPSDGNVNIEYMPKQKGAPQEKDFKGGDYVEYEEVK